LRYAVFYFIYSMKISDIDYELPNELIAQEPAAERSASRMMTVDRASGEIADRQFTELPSLLAAGDVLVLNNTKVFPARLIGRSETGAVVEVFLVREEDDLVWEALARPARRLPVGKRITFGDVLSAEVFEKRQEGKIAVRFESVVPLDDALEQIGQTPLPPYIKRGHGSTASDRDRYQTVFAKQRGSIAAPTAGLHFTDKVIASIREQGVEIVEITLHVGYGTFEPVRVEEISEHRVSSEIYDISGSSAEALNQARSRGRRITAVGTTTTRALESCITNHGKFMAGRQTADLTITPGYEFKAVKALLTNFHLPKSSLLILVSTFAGRELIMKAYEHAVDESYRFYSYGDCMFIT
jgi:S-adenosylmethionine:tRNA ribosyltransferase-isomerase